jgi:hypothetical protein
MKIEVFILAAIALAATAGCRSTPAFDRSFGDAARLAAVQQTRDPGASASNDGRVVDGIEGRAARESMDRYYKSYAEPPRPSNVFNIGVGTGGAGGER